MASYFMPDLTHFLDCPLQHLAYTNPYSLHSESAQFKFRCVKLWFQFALSDVG